MIASRNSMSDGDAHCGERTERGVGVPRQKEGDPEFGTRCRDNLNKVRRFE